jgi:glycosyltransferase involved in cell wall biosynthesis
VKIRFYAAVDDPVLFEHVEFYRQDIEILRALGHTVVPARRPSELRGRCDLVWAWWQTSGMPAVVAARLRGTPAVLLTALSDSDQSASGMPSKSLAARTAGRLALRAADLVLAASENTRLGLTSYATRELWTAPLAVDTDLYRPSGGPSDDYALCISHLTADNVRRKRVCDFVRAVASVPGLRGVIVGRHSTGAGAVRAAIAESGAGDRIEMVGPVSAERKLELLQNAAVYVQPTDYEAFGMAIAEAMACATPVLSTRVGNVPDLVGDTGVLLDPDSGADAFAAALEEVLGEPDGAARRGARARQRVEELYSVPRRRVLVERALARASGGRDG